MSTNLERAHSLLVEILGQEALDLINEDEHGGDPLTVTNISLQAGDRRMNLAIWWADRTMRLSVSKQCSPSETRGAQIIARAIGLVYGLSDKEESDGSAHPHH